MRKSVFVLAVIGAACSSVAFAGEVKKDTAHIPAVKATTMSDSDMDKVTAGAAHNEFLIVVSGVCPQCTAFDVKDTGSVSLGHNVGAAFGGDGAHNFHQHIGP
jgi:hypothetical protein